MKDKININQLVDETINSVSKIDSVKAPPFFKDKVLNRMVQQNEQQEKGVRYLNWFTPKYQAAALICFVLLNTAVLLSNSNTTDSYTEDVSDFADVYGITSSTSDTYIY
ncbi:hypothetical protein [Aurantibacter sp.]|uniref:hypothetical protein n=1 Tax=Aurantibacter sp. TaxID=2807103 RepID=UPI00326645BF